ncbi:MAG: spore cortex biosynthesis protein YabQ [Oscillospiraceae bacterium]|nr:spore cortex biosynthesis protein YabQ [Oscillospiraceae bacterium]
MIENMTPQTILLGQAVIVGVLVGIFYDVFRIIRRIFPLRYATIIIQDILFWVVSAVGVFFAAIWWGKGVVRIYFLLVVLVAALLYCLTVGSVIVFVVGKIIEAVRAFFNLVGRYIMLPIWGFLRRVATKCVETVKKTVKINQKFRKKQKGSCKSSKEPV